MKITRIFAVVLATLLLLACCTGCGEDPVPDGETVVTFFRADKADAMVIRSGSAAIVIDTGLEKNEDDLVKELEELGIRRIDALIVTHFDKDHVGGAAELIRRFPIGTVYQSNSPKDSEEYEEYVEALAEKGITPVTVGETVSFAAGSASITVDGPAQSVYDPDPSNNSSLIVTLTAGDCTVLFGGDAEDLRLQEFLQQFRRPEGPLILKMPYHGNWQSMLPAFLNAVRPDAAILTCSKKEPDEDERLRTEALLESMGAAVYRTFEGDITLRINGEGYSMEQ